MAGLLAGLALALGACSSPTTPTPPPGAPTLTCPTDVTVESASGASVVVNYTQPTAVGGAPPVAVACAPSSGSSFAPGATVVNCTAADSLQRTATCGFSVRVSVPPRLRATRFLAFGDSMTAGEVTNPLSMKLVVVPAASYPTRLQARLTARYTTQSVSVSNAGKPGEATSDGVSRLGGLLAAAPEVVLLMDGANDLFFGNPATVDPAVANVRTMVVAAKRTGASVLLATLPPQREGGSRARGFALVPVFNGKLASIALQEGVPLVDVYTAFGGVAGTYIGEDGLHPNEAGYQKIADTFFERIRSTLEIPGVLTSDGASAPLGRIVPDAAGTTSAAPGTRRPPSPRGRRLP